MKIAVIGTFILDQIIGLDKTVTHSLGGISYAMASLANVLSNNDIIYPVANIGENAAEKIHRFLDQFNNVDKSLLREHKGPNTRVKLEYYSRHERYETLSHIAPPVTPQQLQQLDDMDIILLNYVTGFEMEFTTHILLQHMTPMVYMDYHSLTLGIDGTGRRFRRKPENWLQWLRGVTILQMNEHEARLLSDSPPSFDSFARVVFAHGVDSLNITCGARGSLLYCSSPDEHIRFSRIQPVDFGQPVDVTGCGDAFAGGFIAEFIRSHDYEAAARHANQVAGFCSTLRGIENMHMLKRFRN